MFSAESSGRTRATQAQFAVLLQFMEVHGDLGQSVKTPIARVKADRQWLKLTKILNRVSDGVQKPVDRWKKVWADWKAKTKKKASQLQRRLGPDFMKKLGLNELEKRLVMLIMVANKSDDSSAKLPEPITDAEESDNDPLRGEMEEPQTYTLFERVIEDEDRGAPSPAAAFEVSISPRVQSPEPDPSPAHNGEHAEDASARRSPGARARRARRIVRCSGTSAFVAIERARLRLEEKRELNLHEREMCRLQTESRRVRVDEQFIGIWNRFVDIAEKALEKLT